MYVSKQNSPEIIGDTGRSYVVGLGQNVLTTDKVRVLTNLHLVPGMVTTTTDPIHKYCMALWWLDLIRMTTVKISGTITL